MASIPTIRICNPAKPGKFFVINASDFDPSKHERFEESAEPEGGFVHRDGDDPASDKCVVCSKPEPHSHVPTLDEYVAAGYSAEGHAIRFWNQKPGDVYSEELDALPKPQPPESSSAAGHTSTPEVPPSTSDVASQAAGSASDAAPVGEASTSTPVAVISTKPASSEPSTDGQPAKKGRGPKGKGARG